MASDSTLVFEQSYMYGPDDLPSEPCVPAFTFASNGRPNFARMPGLPYVPGTGAQWFEDCGPVSVSPAPVPTLPGLGLGALLGLLLLGVRRARA